MPIGERPSGKLYVADLFAPVNPDDFDFPRMPREVACFLAEWELKVSREQGIGAHVVPIQWSRELAAFIGVGPPEWLTDRAARVLAHLSEITPDGVLRNVVPIVGAYRTDCGHAFAIVARMEVTPAVRAEFKRPLWHCC